MEITYHGQSCFELSDGEATLLVDPFLKPNSPTATVSADDVNPTHIAITHGHADHMADAVGVAKRTGAHCVSVVELVNWLVSRGVPEDQVSDPNLGGTVRFEWGSIKLVPAWHTSTLPGSAEQPFSSEHGVVVGTATGLIIEMGGLTIYDAGDTCLFGDMELIGRRHKPDIALLPIGGHYTMDRHDAAYAAELIGAQRVIPIHYNTFPAIETDVDAFRDELARRSIEVLAVQPGESVTL